MSLCYYTNIYLYMEYTISAHWYIFIFTILVSHCQHKEQKKDYPVGDEFRAIHKEIVETGSLAKRTESGSVEATHNEEGLNEESKNRISKY